MLVRSIQRSGTTRTRQCFCPPIAASTTSSMRMNVILARVGSSSLSSSSSSVSSSSVATTTTVRRKMSGSMMIGPYQRHPVVPLTTATGSSAMMISSKKTTAMAAAPAAASPFSSLSGVLPSFSSGQRSSSSSSSSSPSSMIVRWKSTYSNGGGSSSNLKKSSKKTFRPRRTPDTDYVSSVLRKATNNNKAKTKSTTIHGGRKKEKGPKEPNDVSTSFPKVDFSNIRITETVDVTGSDDYDDPTINPFVDDPLMSSAVKMLRASAADTNTTIKSGNELDIESQLKMMDFFTSLPGSTEDLVGSRRAVALEALQGEDPDLILQKIDEIVEQERLRYMDLPPTERITLDEMNNEASTGSTKIPPNQLAHGDWGEILVRTDRVCKMWRGGRIESYRALVVGGNLRGCGGFGIGKAFEPEDAVEIACRMAKRNIFFVEPYRGRGLTRDLVGRQNSCRVYLRATDNGLRGNPLSCEILKLMGITNVVAKAHGSRNHFNVCRATFKALLTHESLDEIAMKRGVRLINLQKAKRLGV